MNLEAAYGTIETLSEVEGFAARVEQTGQIDRFVYHGFIALRPAARIVFSGSATGEHSLDVYASSAERIRAHWVGYTTK